MFRYRQNNQEWREELDDDRRREALRRYVSKNKVIPAHFKAAEKFGGKESAGVKKLLQAIADGDYESKHFANKATPDLLLYMIEKEIIPYWQGMSAYMFTVTLAQFSDKQRLAAGDEQVRLERDMEFLDLVDRDSGELTQQGADYCHNLSLHFSDFGLELSVQDVKNAIQKLSPFDQKVVSVNNKYVGKDERAKPVYDMFDLVSGVVFFSLGKRDRQLIPSMSLINAVLELLPHQSMQMLPIIGTVGDKTRNQLHAKDQHPVAVYSSSVKSNIKNVHGRRCGPVPAYWHDVGHVIWASLFTPAEREVLQSYIIPALEKVKAKLEGDKADKIADLINDLSDYDLTPLMNYRNPEKRFEFYLIKQMTKNKLYEDADLVNKMIVPALRVIPENVARENHLSKTLPTLNAVILDAKASVKGNKFLKRLSAGSGNRPYSYTF